MQYRYKKSKANGISRDEHRIIVENSLGRKLEFNECVHHLNGVKTDNRLENLCVMSRSEHARIHIPPILSGEKARTAKLTWEGVEQIRASELPTTELLPQFSVSRSTLNRVRAGTIWK